jgi:F-type H+-transporting ATPase subunit b
MWTWREPEFWVAVGFVIFVGFALYMGVVRLITGSLDERARRIAAELAEATRLRQEADALVAEYEQKRRSAESEAAAIVATAKEEAERTAKEAHQRLSDFVARRTAAAEAKIAQAETQALADVRAAAADAAVRASEIVLRDRMKGPGGTELLAKGVAEVKAKLN